MRNHQPGDRLSWGDTVFLNLEREGMPLNVACLCVLEGDIPFEAYLRFVESRLPLIPRYLKRVVPSALNVGLPSWDYDPTFDIRNHVREASAETRDGCGAEGTGGEDPGQGDGPAASAVGSDTGPWIERQSDRYRRPHASLPRGWNCRRGHHERPHGCESKNAAYAEAKTPAECPTAARHCVLRW